jgi:outer membrane receptor protein involved in Fe transport
MQMCLRDQDYKTILEFGIQTQTIILRILVKAAEIQVGGSYRLYELNSGGRIYTDADSQINYTDYGAYTQIQKKLMEDRLKLTGSVRYDKSKKF